MKEERGNSEWHHAVDLCTKEDYRELLETRHFTTTHDICRAISFSIDCGRGVDAKIAREMLEFLGVPEPDGRSIELLARPPKDMSSPFCQTDDAGADAWMRVHALEDKRVKRGKNRSLIAVNMPVLEAAA